MSLRTRVLNLVDVLLRVPPLFVIDELLRIGLGVQEQVETTATIQNDNSTIIDSIVENTSYDAQFYKFLIITCIKVILSCIGKYENGLYLSFSG